MINRPEQRGRFARYPRNERGRDFIVGDIHGCLGDLVQAMADVSFDPERDRLFSVGDLIDRGPESLGVLELAQEPWFHAVAGNHEEVAREALEMIVEASAGGGLCLPDEALRRIQLMGSEWLLNEIRRAPTGADLFRVGRLLFSTKDWPLAIEIDTPAGSVGIVHADPSNADWRVVETLLTMGETPPMSANALVWGKGCLKRALAGNAAPSDMYCRGLWRLYSGHTPVGSRPIEYGNRVWIDSGAIHGIGQISLLEVAA